MAKKKAAKRKRPAKTEIAVEVVEGVVLLLVRYRDAAAAREQAIADWRLSEKEADAALAEARRRLTLAADYDRVEELGRAIGRHNDLYEAARTALNQKGAEATGSDINACTNILKEISRLLDLYRPSQLPGGDNTLEAAELRQVRDYLAALEIPGGEDLPAAELARIAVTHLANRE